MKKIIKQRIQKLVLICSTLLMSIPAAALTPAAAAGVAVGVIAGTAIIAGVATHERHKRHHCDNPDCKICKKNRRREEKKQQHVASQDSSKYRTKKKSMSSSSSKSKDSEPQSVESKRSMKKDLKHLKRQRCHHKTALHKLENENNGNGPAAQGHKTELERIESDIRDLESKIDTAL